MSQKPQAGTVYFSTTIQPYRNPKQESTIKLQNLKAPAENNSSGHNWLQWYHMQLAGPIHTKNDSVDKDPRHTKQGQVAMRREKQRSIRSDNCQEPLARVTIRGQMLQVTCVKLESRLVRTQIRRHSADHFKQYTGDPVWTHIHFYVCLTHLSYGLSFCSSTPVWMSVCLFDFCLTVCLTLHLSDYLSAFLFP